ncbi:coil containing protein [Vibrio phage 1.191.O._10N.286.52.B4]|nr:coil containing protein [Vibrio phage 1.191.O._10N.286.52.B4]
MKFPLILSCGHTTRKSLADPIDCGCNVQSQYQSNGETPIDKALVQFQGQWRTVLENYSVKLPSNKKHGACPVCGGKDRFRFDDKNGLGTWYCSQCPEQSGGGLKLLSMYLGKTTMATAKELVGDDLHRSIAPKRIHTVNHDEVRAANIEQAKKGAKLMVDAATMAIHSYMDNKGLSGEWLVNGEPMMSREGITQPGELLLVPVYKASGSGITELVNVQKITKDGKKRPLFGGDMQGVHHVIDGATKNIAIAEGFATGVTINQATKWKTYVSFNTGNLAAAVKQAKDDHPYSSVIIFGDHDKLDENHNRRPGEYYANEAAAAYGAGVVIPDMDIETTGDWDDYRQSHGMDALKATLRDMVKKELGNIKAPVVKPVIVESAPEPAPEPVVAPVITPEPTPPQAFGSWLNAAPAPQPVVAPPQKGTGKTKDLPQGISFEGMDIDRPPGLAGEIVEYIEHGAHRPLTGGAYSLFAIQTMAMAGSGITGFMDSKLSLITITLGVSAGGKERPQKVMKELLHTAGINVYGDIRSDKDILRAAIYDQGRCFYVIDEAHKLLSRAAKSANPNAEQIVGTLMNIATTSLLSLSQLHQGEFSTGAFQQIARLEKQLSAKEDIKLGYNQQLEKPKIEVIDIEIQKIKTSISEQQTLLDTIGHGIKNPCLNLAASSTPQKMSDMINEDNIEQGFLGRGIIVDCGTERSRKRTNLRDRKGAQDHKGKILIAKLEAEIGMIAQLSKENSEKQIDNEFNGVLDSVDASDEAYQMICEIDDHYEQYEYLNHERLGPLFARVSERVVNLASILALGNLVNGVMTIEVEHVKYALMLSLNSITMLESNLRVNEAKDGDTIEAKLEGIKEAILKKLNVAKDDLDDGWRMVSKIKANIKRQRFYQDMEAELLKHDQSAFNNAISALQGAGLVQVSGTKIRLTK